MSMESQPAPEEIIETPVEASVEESIETPVEAAPESSEGEGAVETPTYEANLMFKVHGQEKEFDDWAKPLVKDAESEQQYRDIMEKVHGIEHIKEDREALRAQTEELQTVAQKYQTLEGELETLDKFIGSKNFDAFFQKAQISEQDVLQWAAKRLQYHQMSPEQQSEYDRSVQAQTNEVYFGQQAMSMQDQMQTLKYEQTQFRLDQHIAQPGISEAVVQFDQSRGAGAFRHAVEERGLLHYHTTGQDVPVEQAVAEVMAIAGMQTQQPVPGPAQQMAPQAPSPQTPPAMPQATKKPVIPTVNGGGQSPVRPVVKSIEDIKRIREARS